MQGFEIKSIEKACMAARCSRVSGPQPVVIRKQETLSSSGFASCSTSREQPFGQMSVAEHPAAQVLSVVLEP